MRKDALLSSPKSKNEIMYEELKATGIGKTYKNKKKDDEKEVENEKDERTSKLLSGTGETFNGKQPTKMETLLGLNSYHYPLDGRTSSNAKDLSMNCIRALSDLFTCPVTSYPVSVGIFDRDNKDPDNFDSSHSAFLIRLINGIQKMSQIDNTDNLKVSILLLILPAVVTVIISYIVSIFATWTIGLIVGAVCVVVQYLFLILMIFEILENKLISKFINSMTQTIALFLHIIFCNPKRPKKSPSKLKVITIYHVVDADESGQIVLSVVEKLWRGLMKHFGFYIVRLQRVFRSKDQSSGRFKRICCFPTFIVCIAWLLAVLTLIFMINKLSENFPTNVNQYKDFLPVFVIVCGITFLGSMGCCPTFFNIIKAFFVSPTRELNAASREYVRFKTTADLNKNMTSSTSLIGDSTPIVEIELGTSGFKRKQAYLKNLFKYLYSSNKSKAAACNADMLSKSEFQNACKLVTDFDCFLREKQTRIIICIDATGMENREGLAKLIYRMHSLLLADPDSPVAVVIHADYKLLFGDVNAYKENPEALCQVLSDSYHLVHTSLHLPIYLDPLQDSIVLTKDTRSSNNPANLNNTTNFALLNKLLKSNVIHQASMMEREKTIESAPKPVKRIAGIAELYLDGSELSDLNLKIIKKLVALTAFTSRLLRLKHVTVNTNQLVAWVTLIEHWPFHIIYLTTVLNEITDGSLDDAFSNKVRQHMNKDIEKSELDLETLISLIQSNLLKLPHYVSSLMADDKDPEKLLSYVKKDCKYIFTLSDMKNLLSSTLFISPFIKTVLEMLSSDSNTKLTKSLSTFVPNSDQGQAAYQTLDSQTVSNSQDVTSSDYTTQNLQNPTICMKEHSMLVKSKSEQSSIKLNQMTVEQVCLLIDLIGSISEANANLYKTKIRQHNITGMVLSVCDLDQLRSELSMTFGDWQLLQNHILRLRQQKSIGKLEKYKNPLEASLSLTPIDSVRMTPSKNLYKNPKFYEQDENFHRASMRSKLSNRSRSHSRDGVHRSSSKSSHHFKCTKPAEEWTTSQDDEEESNIESEGIVNQFYVQDDATTNTCESVDDTSGYPLRTKSKKVFEPERFNYSAIQNQFEATWDFEVDQKTTKRNSKSKIHPSNFEQIEMNPFIHQKKKGREPENNQCTCESSSYYGKRNQTSTSASSSENLIEDQFSNEEEDYDDEYQSNTSGIDEVHANHYNSRNILGHPSIKSSSNQHHHDKYPIKDCEV